MSYTMTIEAPEKAAWLAQRRLKISPEQLGVLFVSFLMQKEAEVFEVPPTGDSEEGDYVRQRDAILSAAGGWQDTRSEDEIITDIEAHRTSGREVVL